MVLPGVPAVTIARSIAGLAGLAAVLGVGGAAAGPTASAPCPAALLPLTANPIGPASAAALRREPAENRSQVVAASLATRDRERGGQAKAMCGTQVWRRTVVVYVTRRALLPSQSLSQGAYFVGRFKAGYRVWFVAH